MRIIVTGGNSGIGKATATALAAAGHSVLIACRTIPKAEQAAAEMAGDVEVAHLDLADLASVREVRRLGRDRRRAGEQRRCVRSAAHPHGGRLRGAHGHQPPRPFRVDLPARRQDQGPGGLGDEQGPTLFSRIAPRRPELAHPQVLEVGGLRRIEAGRHALRPGARPARRACDTPSDPGGDGHRHRPGQHRVSGLARVSK